MKLQGKIILALLFIGGVWGAKYFFMDSSWALSHKATQASILLQQSAVSLPDAPKNAQGENVAPAALPTDKVATVTAPLITIEAMAWNSQFGLMFSNGGPLTTSGSIMEKHGAKVQIKRQDDCDQMKANIIKFAKDYKDNPAGAQGTNFIAIMGDGAPSWLAAANAELEKLGPEYKAQIIYSMGKSLGEDKFMAPLSVKENPQNAKGLVCAAVLRDGDWNIVIKWCTDNGIAINVDEKTYDKSAMNFVAATDFLDAAQKYISNFTEIRDDVVNGKRTGKKDTVKVTAVTTWTPGDVNVAELKGGLVSIVSTAEYRSQMPNVLIGINKYMNDNRAEVENMLTAIGEGGDQVKSFDGALQKAGDISAQVYKEKDGNYWTKYYRGVQQSDKQGNIVNLGGSRAHNLGDNLELFGLNPGSVNVYASVYKVFGDIDVKLYPKLIPSYPAYNDVVDMTYINDIKSKAGASVTSADKVVFHADANITTVSKRAWTIEFETGSANFTSKTLSTLDDLYNQLIVANGLSIEVIGHTDNTGSAQANVTLSQARAEAVKNWLAQKAPTQFPANRFAKVEGRGQNEPIADNSSATGKARNRRVEIVLGK